MAFFTFRGVSCESAEKIAGNRRSRGAHPRRGWEMEAKRRDLRGNPFAQGAMDRFSSTESTKNKN